MRIEYAMKSAPRTGAEMIAIYTATHSRLRGNIQSPEPRKPIARAARMIEIMDKQQEENEELRAIIAKLNAQFELARTIKNELRNTDQSELERTQEAYPSIWRIKVAVADFYSIKVLDIVSGRRPVRITRPRQIAMYLCHELTPRSYPDIGRNFGGKDHTTVLHATRIIAKRALDDAELRDEIEELKRRVRP